MLTNPEFKRNIWLDFTLHRVLLTLIIVTLFVYIASLFGSSNSSESLAFWIAAFFIFIWGTKSASETVIEEVNHNTWDFQRQSSISPWSMTFGKLMGATAFSWCAALFTLLFYLFPMGEASAILGASKPFAYKITRVYILIMGGLLGQAIALLLSLQVLSQDRTEKSLPSFKYWVVGIILGLFFANITLGTHHLSNYLELTAKPTLTWYHWQIETELFMKISLFLFLLWSIVGLKRSFAKELQYPQLPWVWFAFNLYCLIYFIGLGTVKEFTSYLRFDFLTTIQNQLEQTPYFVGFIVAQLLTYIALVYDDLTRLRYKKMLIAYRSDQKQQALQVLPWWTISLVFTIIMMIINLLTQPDIGNITQSISPSIFIFTSTLFMIRDVLIFHFFYFAKDPRKALSTSVIYLALLYILIPLLIKGIDLEGLLPILVPSWGQNNFLGIVSPLVQIAVLGFLCYQRWDQKDDTP